MRILGLAAAVSVSCVLCPRAFLDARVQPPQNAVRPLRQLPFIVGMPMPGSHWIHWKLQNRSYAPGYRYGA